MDAGNSDAGDERGKARQARLQSQCVRRGGRLLLASPTMSSLRLSANKPAILVKLARSKAVVLGLVAIVGVALLETFNSLVCYKHDLAAYLFAMLFIGIPMLPALVSLA